MSDPHRLKTGNPERVIVPRATGEQGDLTSQGMLSPINDFVDSAGNLTSVSFRFLYSLWSDLQALKASTSVLALEALVNAVGQQFWINQITNAPAMPQVVGATMTGTGLYFTPRSSRVLLTMDASIYNTLAGGVSIGFFAWGSGTFPGVGSPYLGPPTQTITGQFMRAAPPIASQPMPFTQSTVLGNLTPGTQYWSDYGLAAGSGATWITDVEFQILGLIDPVGTQPGIP